MKSLMVWPHGGNFVFQGTLLNGAGASGDHVYTLTTAAGVEVEVLYGRFLNGDAASRVGRIEIDDGTNVIGNLMIGQTITAGSSPSFPVSEAAGNNSVISAGTKVLVSGGIRVVATMAAVAISENTAFAITVRVRGSVPTMTLAGPAGVTATTNTSKVF